MCNDGLPGSRSRHSAGVNVSDTTIEAINAARYAKPSGRSSSPSIPGKKKSGANAAAITNVAKRMAPRTSEEAVKIVSSTDLRRSTGRASFCRKRRNTFSTSMMASSTKAPMAMVRPPRVMVSMASPKIENVSTPATREVGKARAEIRVDRASPRKSSRTSTTRMAPSTSAVLTLVMAISMKSACRKFSRSRRIPAGNDDSSSASRRSIARVSWRVLAPGCFCTESTTAGRAL